MANRAIIAKRARLDASREVKAVQSTSNDDVISLRVELEAAKKCIEQLRREKDCEVRQVRDDEQTKSAIALKDLTAELHRQRQQDVEMVREALRSRYEADSVKVARRYERTIKKLRNDLDRCQNVLRDEVEKRGVSSSVRAGFEAERNRLIQEVRDLGGTKRRLEEALQAAHDVNKQKTAELRRLQEQSKLDVARVSKEANAEIRKLLEELKSKDHQLEQFDRSLHPDRPPNVKHQPEVTADVTSSKAVTEQSELVDQLKASVERLTNQLTLSETERVGFKIRLEELRKELVQRNEVITNLELIIQEKVGNGQKQKLEPAIKCQQKAVRFLLPGATLPVLARELPAPPHDDDITSVSSDISELTSTSSQLSSETPFFYDENLEKNYHLLLSEHITLQRSVACLLTMTSSLDQSTVSINDKPKLTDSHKDCLVEKDSMKVALEALEDKLRLCEEMKHQLELQLAEKQEQNEELEFRLFELEDSADKQGKILNSGDAMDDVLERNRGLEVEILVLKSHLKQFEELEREAIQSAGMHLPDYITWLHQQHEQMTQQLETSKLEMMELKGQLEVKTHSTAEEQIVRETVLEAENTADYLDVDDDDVICPMTCSISSATSGFDDNSCASSVVDLKLDEMPTEETWGFEENLTDIEPTSVDDVSEQSSISASFQTQESKTFVCSQCMSGREMVSQEKVLELEELWSQRVEKLEQKLQQSVDSERRVRDQLALLSEEKDRRIMALQDQVDLLEANEFQLSETIQSLEQLEHTLVSHQLKSTHPHEVEENDEVTDNEKGLKLQLPSSEELFDCCNASADGGINYCCNLEKCFRRDACVALKNTIKQLQSAQMIRETLNKRIKELEQDTSCQTESKGQQFTDHVCDFQADCLELESLVKELKTVLFAQNVNLDNEVVIESNVLKTTVTTLPSTQPCSTLPTGTNLAVMVDERSCWPCCENCFSLPASPDLEVPRLSSDALSERNRELELTEQYLCHQICELEKEREALYKMAQGNESTIRDLSIQVVELQASEDTLQEEVTRHKAKEGWMNARIDDLMELVARLEETVKGHLATESELKSRMERHQTSESDLRHELENTMEEMKTGEMKMRRRILQLEEEREELVCQMNSLTERNCDLEGREVELLCKIKKMETVEQELRKAVTELEKVLGVLGYEGQKESLLEKSLNMEDIESGRVMDVRYYQGEISHLNEALLFLKESLETSQQSNAILEAKIKECSEIELMLRGSISEYEKIDKIWQEKVQIMETCESAMSNKICQLESELSDIKSRHAGDSCVMTSSRDFQKLGATVPTSQSNDESLTSFSAAVKSLMLLNEIVNEDDDVELSYWAAVESTASDDVTEADLTSPYWAQVENYMGLNSISEESSDVVKADKAVNQLTVVKAAQHVGDEEYDTVPPPLPTSPPPDSPQYDQQATGFRLTSDNQSDEVLNCVNHTVDCNSMKPKIEVRVHASAPRSQSADLFHTVATPVSRKVRAVSESRDQDVYLAQTRELTTQKDESQTLSSSRSNSLPGQVVLNYGSNVSRLKSIFSEHEDTPKRPSFIPHLILRQTSTATCSIDDKKTSRAMLPVIGSMLPTLRLDKPTEKKTKTTYNPELHSRMTPTRSYLPRYVGNYPKTTLSEKDGTSSRTQQQSSYQRVLLSSNVSDSKMDSSASIQCQNETPEVSLPASRP